MKLHTETFIGAKFDNDMDMSTFFVDKPDQKYFLLQHLLGWINSYSCPHFIGRSPWQDWKTLFVKLHTETFIGAKLDNDMDMSTFFGDNPDQKFLLCQHQLGWIHSYSIGWIHSYFSPQSIWTSPSLDWQTLFVKLHTDTPLSAKFDNDMSTF